MPPRKYQTFSHQQNIWIVTNYGEFKVQLRKHFKLSPYLLPHSYGFSRVINRFMASCDVPPSKILDPYRTKINEEKIDTLRNRVEEKPNSSISLPTPISNSVSELVNSVERYAASLNKHQIIAAVNDILARALACIESDGGAFEYKLKSFKKKLNR